MAKSKNMLSQYLAHGLGACLKEKYKMLQDELQVNCVLLNTSYQQYTKPFFYACVCVCLKQPMKPPKRFVYILLST